MTKFKTWVSSSFSTHEEVWDEDLRVVCKIEKSNHSLEDSILITEAGEVRHETGKTPRQLAEENAKLRELCNNFLRVTVSAINAGDWKVDGAADPDSLIREANKVL